MKELDIKVWTVFKCEKCGKTYPTKDKKGEALGYAKCCDEVTVMRAMRKYSLVEVCRG